MTLNMIKPVRNVIFAQPKTYSILPYHLTGRRFTAPKARRNIATHMAGLVSAPKFQPTWSSGYPTWVRYLRGMLNLKIVVIADSSAAMTTIQANLFGYVSIT
jgi:hypothetical protein